MPLGWSILGTDLLDDAPTALRDELVGDDPHPSRHLDDIITADGSPPRRMTVSERSPHGVEWAYILHPHGIEAVALREYTRGPVVNWDTDPLTRFLNSPQLWNPTGPLPANPPPRPTQLPTALSKSTAAPAPTPRPAPHR